jgi:hypothetical protein
MRSINLGILIVGVFAFTGIFAACEQQAQPFGAASASIQPNIQEIAEDYFNTYAEREDWEKLLSFYSPYVQFTDELLDHNLSDLDELANFYNWPDTAFRKKDPEIGHLKLDHITTNDSVAIGFGHFTPYYWKGILYAQDAPAFTIILEFDENMKIERQVDYIEYPPELLVEYYNN